MKIAIITSGGVHRSGVERVVPCLLWLVERLVRGGDEVHVFTLYQEQDPGSWQLLGATMHSAGRRHSRSRLFAQLISEHRRSPFHVIHSIWSLWAHIIAVAAGKLLRLPILLYFGAGELCALADIGYGDQLSRKARALLRIAIAGSDRIATQSAYMVTLARALNIQAERLPFGVALDRWPPSAPRSRKARSTAKLLHVADVIPVKDHGMLIDTAARLRDMGIRFELDVIGKDIHGSGIVQRLAEERDLTREVRVHGFLPHSASRKYFEDADLLLVTSRHEAGPLVALEAAVAGVPTVGTHVGHLAEWAPEAARVVEPRDSAGLAQAVARLITNEDERLPLAARAQEKALAEDADTTSRHFRETYAELIRNYR